ncbi:hypothetical protein EI94DRAFT_619407 [Lactarius quietus]|nr:hypothetical protein EI94DRAFT_619407 [Lactarius quietus]
MRLEGEPGWARQQGEAMKTEEEHGRDDAVMVGKATAHGRLSLFAEYTDLAMDSTYRDWDGVRFFSPCWRSEPLVWHRVSASIPPSHVSAVPYILAHSPALVSAWPARHLARVRTHRLIRAEGAFAHTLRGPFPSPPVQTTCGPHRFVLLSVPGVPVFLCNCGLHRRCLSANKDRVLRF